MPDSVALIVELPLAARDLDRYGIRELSARGLTPTVLDVGGLTQPEVPQRRDHYGEFAGLDLRMADSKESLLAHMDALKRAAFILGQFGTFGCSPANLPVYRALAAAGRPSFKLFVNAYPGWQNAATPSALWKRRLQRIGSIRPVRSAMARMPMQWLGVKPDDAAIFSGRKSIVRNQVVTESTRPVFGHSLDYEAYLHLAHEDKARDGTAVFVDENVGFQIDAGALGVVYDFTLDHYTARLRALFERVERELGLEVVIAGNPRADYSARREAYGNRRILQGRTLALVSRADLVVGHRSTALGMAIMCGKPVLQVGIQGHYRHWVNRVPYDGFATALGKPIVFVDTDAYDLSTAMKLDLNAYERYMEDYVKLSTSPRRPLWDIVIDAFQG